MPKEDNPQAPLTIIHLPSNDSVNGDCLDINTSEDPVEKQYGSSKENKGCVKTIGYRYAYYT